MEANKETEKLLSPKRRSKGAERQKEEGGISGKDIAMFGAEMVPGVGEAMAVKRTSDALDEKDYLGAGIEATAGLLGIIPGVGDAAGKALRTGFKKTRKAYKLFVKGEDNKLYPLFVDADKEIKQGEFLEANFPDVAFKGKRTPGSDEKNYVPTKGAKRTKGEKAKNTGDPVIIPDEETRKKLIDEGFITERSKRTEEAPFGKVTAVAARPGFHASQSPVATHLGPQDLKISKKEADKLIEAGVTPEAIKRRGNQFYVKRRAEDQVFAEVDMADDVDYQSMLAKEGRSDINDRVPKGGSYKYSDGQADSDQWVVGGDMRVNRVLSREETRAIQKEMGVVDLPYRDEVETILDKKFAKGGVVMDDYLVAKMMDKNDSKQKFAEGGMPKQMEMFEDGGLMDEGGSVDPVSGNDVPPGSTQEEVRDDIPAQLSEGEFVFPADVVRYIGLGNLMRMRQEAKMGLKLMDQMGQMGNSEEATMPDDLPFDINDLDMEDEIDDNNELEMQVGGFVQPTQQQQQMGISGYQQAAAPTTGVAAVPQQAASQQYVQPVQPVQAAVPTMQAYKPEEVPTFQQTIGDDAFGTYDELRQYRNEAGNIINVPFRNGQPISPIPEGYTFVDPEETSTEEVTTTPVTTETTQVREPESDKDDRPEPRGAVFALGTFSENGRMGGKEGEDYFNFNVSFDTRKEGSIPGTMGVLGLAAGLATGKGLPEGTIATLEYDGTEMKVGAKEYNAAREDRYGDKAQELIQRFKEKRDNEIKAAKALAEEYGLKYTGQTLAEMAKATNAIDAENKRKEAQERADVLAAQKLKDEKAKQAELDRVAREREQRAIYGGGDGGGGTSGRGYSVGRQTGLGEGATPGGYGGTGRGRSDAPGNSASSNRSSGGSGGSFDSRGGRGRFGGNEGGLASKPKPKTKKMKKGGLASKK